MFAAACATDGRRSLPADPGTVAAWITALGDGTHGGNPLACTTINQYLCAIVVPHHTTGQAFYRKHPVLAETRRGISRHKAKTQPKRQAKVFGA